MLEEVGKRPRVTPGGRFLISRGRWGKQRNRMRQ